MFTILIKYSIAMVHIANPNSIPLLKTDEFLPSVSPWTTFTGFLLVGAVGITVVLASFVKYNVAVQANATLRPAGELRVVQAEIEGSIRQIEVEENQTVQQGQVIAVLEDTKLQIQKSQLQSSIQQNQFQLAQLDAQIRQLDAQILAESQSSSGAVIAAEAEIRRNRHEYQERERTAQAEVEEAIASLELATDEMRRYQQLVADGAVSELQLQEKQTAVRTAQARLARANASLNPTDAAITIAQEQVTQQVARGEATIASLQRERESLLQRQSEVQTQLIREQKELEQVEQNLEQMVIRATSDGVIFKLNLSNPSQVVRPGETIAQIAPNATPMVIKAAVANQDIDRVEVGQMAQLRIDACPYPDYGTLNGVVSAVAPDASGLETATANSGSQSDNQAGNNRTFEVTIQPEATTFGRGIHQCQLQPGMEASASIISREETFLQFVLRKARLIVDL